MSAEVCIYLKSTITHDDLRKVIFFSNLYNEHKFDKFYIMNNLGEILGASPFDHSGNIALNSIALQVNGIITNRNDALNNLIDILKTFDIEVEDFKKFTYEKVPSDKDVFPLAIPDHDEGCTFTTYSVPFWPTCIISADGKSHCFCGACHGVAHSKKCEPGCSEKHTQSYSVESSYPATKQD